jgi:prephenate dehydrogenase
MMTTNILFLGMNRISTSLGLAMKKNSEKLFRIGYDPDLANTRTATQSGALDQSVEDPKAGVINADVILYALPPGKMMDIIGMISQDFKPGCFFVDMNPIGHDTFSQVAKLLPDPRAFIAWVPAVNPIYLLEGTSDPGSAQVDLFNNSHIYIAGDFNTHPEAIKLGSDLAILANAKPINIEPDELAGILALVHDLPLLVSALVTGLITSESGWNEARKLAGTDFARFSSLLESPDYQILPGVQIIANRRNVQRLLTETIEQLSNLRSELDNPDSQVPGQVIRNAAMARHFWQKQRETMSWIEQIQGKLESPSSLTDRLLGKRKK